MRLRFGSVILLAVFMARASSSAADLSVTSGLADDQVLQRDGRGGADVAVTGAGAGGFGAVQGRVLYRGDPLPGFDWADRGTAKDGAWSARIEAVPAGGPYTVEFRVGAGAASATAVIATAVHGVLVGDLWVLAGQSNMEGYGNLVDVQPPDPRVHAFDMQDRWGVAEEPLHSLADAVDPVHWEADPQGKRQRLTGEAAAARRKGRRKGVGPGLPFAVSVAQRTGVPVGLVPCAHGGTSMDQWSPSLKDKGGESLYGAMIRRVGATGGRVRGVLWYQGEGDALGDFAAYLGKLQAFVAAVRADVGIPDLAFYYVQLGRVVVLPETPGWNRVQVDQLRAEGLISRSGMAVAIDLSLDDLIHVGTPGQKRLGARLANLAVIDLFPEVQARLKLKRGPRPTTVQWVGEGKHVLRMGFSDVNGRLRADGRVTGFSIVDPKAVDLRCIYDVTIDPDDPASVLVKVWGDLPAGSLLWYGRGLDPVGNLVDEADMAAPVFGGVPLP